MALGITQTVKNIADLLVERKLISKEDLAKAQETAKKEYQQRVGKKDYRKAYDPVVSDTLDANNAFDVQRAFLQALIGKAKQQTKQQEMYPTAYLT